MRLNCTLVSSLLFVSAALAAGDKAGAKWESKRESRNVVKVFGMFTIPTNIQGPVGSGFTIAVGLDLDCPTATASGGITVSVTGNNEVSIGAWIHFEPTYGLWIPNTVKIIPGYVIEIQIEMPELVSTRASYRMHILDHREALKYTWSASIISPREHRLCKRGAFWAVGRAYTPDGTGFAPLPNFGQVLFRQVRMWDHIDHPLLLGYYDNTDLFIKENDKSLTRVYVRDVRDGVDKAYIRVDYVE